MLQNLGPAGRDRSETPTSTESVEKVLSPLVVGVAHEPHDVAASVKIERARLAGGLHIGFVRKLIALAAIAGMAAGDEILPRGETATRARDHMVEREFARRQRGAAILAGVAIAQENILARQCSGLVRYPAVFKKADHRRHAQREACSVQEMSVLFFGHGNALQHQHNGAPRGANVDRLVGRIQYQHRLVEGMAVAVLVHAGGEQRSWQEPATAHHRRVVTSQRHAA